MSPLTPVVCGTAGVPVRACQGSYAPVQAIGTVRRTGDGTGEQMFCPRAHCLSENRGRRLSALRSAVKTAERSEALA
jgi:hypothetical protein